MNNPTPAAQVAALAELVGITPETHKQFVWDTSSGTNVNVSGYPDPLGPDADGVWLVPFMYWCHKRQMWPQVQGIPRTMPEWEASILFNSINSHRDSTVSATAALLQACLAARVPEICAIFGEAASNE